MWMSENVSKHEQHTTFIDLYYALIVASCETHWGDAYLFPGSKQNNSTDAKKSFQFPMSCRDRIENFFYQLR